MSRDTVIVICSYCNKVIKGNWECVGNGGERPRISHGICAECLQLYFPEEYLLIQEKQKIEVTDIYTRSFHNFYGHLVR